jgi:hypothetical protein
MMATALVRPLKILFDAFVTLKGVVLEILV